MTKTLETLTPEGSEFIYTDINLPLFNQDIENKMPIEVTALKTIIEDANGILIITPSSKEYLQKYIDKLIKHIKGNKQVA